MKAHQCIKSGVFKVSVGIKRNTNKSMEISFTRCRMNDPLNYSFGDRKSLKLAVSNIWESSNEVILAWLIR